MKKIIILTACCVLSAIQQTYAQNNTWLIQADGAYNHTKLEANNSSYAVPTTVGYWNLATNIGFKINHNVLVGVLLGYGQKDYIDYAYYSSSGYKTRVSTFAAGAWGRYTYEINSWLFIYSQLNVVKFSKDIKQIEEYTQPPAAIPSDYYGTPVKGDGLSVSLFPAVGFNIINGYGIDLNLGGISYANNKPTGITEKEFSVTLGQEFRLGLHKFINSNGKNKKKKEEEAK